MEISGSSGKDVKDTKMLNAEAREPSDTVSGSNSQKRYTSKHKAFGKLGAKGRPE